MNTHTHINWREQPIAKRLLGRLTRANVCHERRIHIPADYYYWRGRDRTAAEAILALELIREATLEHSLGGTFLELEAQGRMAEYYAAEAAMVSIYDAISDRLADLDPVPAPAETKVMVA